MQEKTARWMEQLYPLLLALYPPLALLANNILQIRPVETFRSMVVFLFMGVFVVILARIIWKNKQKAAIASFVLLFAFMTYGQMYSVLGDTSILNGELGRHRYLFPLYLGISGYLICRLSKSRRNLLGLNRTLGIGSVILIILPLVQLASNGVMTKINSTANQKSVEQITQHMVDGTAVKPDVYYIILDMYGRDDVLLDSYHYDNTPFLKQLDKLGFVVTKCSMSNYNMTELSMASTFNMNYLDTLGSQYHSGSKDRSGLPSLIHQSAVRKIFENLGYQFINFETGFTFTEIRDADQFLAPSYNELGLSGQLQLNPFESMLIRTTMVSALADAQTKFFSPVNDALDTRRIHVLRELYLLEKLPQLTTETSPKFVYAHVLIPHPPFVFSAEGVDLAFPAGQDIGQPQEDHKSYIRGYQQQLDYINMRLIPILKKLIRNSATPPIIIVQGDHGVDPKRSFILNAYYLPGIESSAIPQTITPVNTFRLILNDYFNESLPYLDDRNLASTDKAPFDFENTKDPRICQ